MNAEHGPIPLDHIDYFPDALIGAEPSQILDIFPHPTLITIAGEEERPLWVTTLLHGAEAAKTAEATAREVFEKGGAGGDLPTLTLSADDVGDGISIVQLIVKSGLANSGKEAKRLIAENGAKLDDAPLTNAGLMIDAAALSSPIKLSAGKKRHALVQLG